MTAICCPHLLPTSLLCDAADPSSYRVHIWCGKTRMAGLRSCKSRMMTGPVVWVQYINMTNSHTAIANAVPTLWHSVVWQKPRLHYFYYTIDTPGRQVQLEWSSEELHKFVSSLVSWDGREFRPFHLHQQTAELYPLPFPSHTWLHLVCDACKQNGQYIVAVST